MNDTHSDYKDDRAALLATLRDLKSVAAANTAASQQAANSLANILTIITAYDLLAAVSPLVDAIDRLAAASLEGSNTIAAATLQGSNTGAAAIDAKLEELIKVMKDSKESVFSLDNIVAFFALFLFLVCLVTKAVDYWNDYKNIGHPAIQNVVNPNVGSVGGSSSFAAGHGQPPTNPSINATSSPGQTTRTRYRAIGARQGEGGGDGGL